MISVRNLGYSKNAGEFVRRFFSDIGSAGGHRAMAKAVIPMRNFRQKFGDQATDGLGVRLHQLVVEFLHEKDVKGHKTDAKSEVGNQSSPLAPTTGSMN